MVDERTPNGASEIEKALAAASGPCLAESILEQAPTLAVVLRQPDGKIISATQFVGQIGHDRRDLEGLMPEELIDQLKPLHPDGRPFALEELPHRRALRGQLVTGVEGSFLDAKGEQVPFVGNAAPIRNRRGRVIGALSVYTDIRMLKRREDELRHLVEEKEALYRELAHRVKNHLHIMSGLTRVEARDAPPAVAEFARRIQGRLKALTSVYESMARCGHGAAVRGEAFVDHVCTPYRTEKAAVDVRVVPPDLKLSSDRAGPLGMILNEAVCNCYKHAFPTGVGHIVVSLTRERPGRLALEITDDGVGLDTKAAGESQGIALMQQQASELSGELEIAGRPGGGTRVVLRLPEQAPH